jgi:hypothetical protein
MAIVETISLEGADEVKSAFEEIGKAGDEALKTLQGVGDSSSGFGEISNALSDIKGSFATVGTAAAQFGTATVEGSSGVLHLADAVASLSSGGLSNLKEGISTAGAAIGEFKQASQTGAGAASGLGSSIGPLGKFFAELAAIASGAGASIVYLAGSASSAATSARNAAASASSAVFLDPKSWQTLALAAESAGVETSTLTSFFEKGTNASASFAKESEKAFNAFKEAGSGWAAGDEYKKTIAELTEKLGVFGTTSEETKSNLLDLADKIVAIDDPSQQAILAINTLGESFGPKLLPLLKLGREAIEGAGADLNASGTKFTAEQLRIADAEQAAISRLKGIFSSAGADIAGFRENLGFLFAPVVTAGADWLTDTLTGWQTAIASVASGALPKAISLLDEFGAALSGGGAEVKTGWVTQFVASIQDLGSAVGAVVSGAFQALLGILDSLAAKFNQVFGTDFSGKSLLLASSIAAISSTFGIFGAAIGAAIALFSPFGANISRILPIISDFIAALSGRDADVKTPWVLEWVQAFGRLGAIISGAVAGAFNLLVGATGTAGAELARVFGLGPIGAAMALAGAVAGLSSGFGVFSLATTAAGAVFASFGADLSNVVPIIKDFVSALTGHAGDVTNPWVLEWLAAIENFGAQAKSVIIGIVLPAFHLLADAAGTVADTINGAFGTNFSGLALLAGVAIFQLAGGFNFLKVAVASVGGIFFDLAIGFGLAGRAGKAFAEILAIFGFAAKGIAPEVEAATGAMATQRGVVGGLSDLFGSFRTSLSNIGAVVSAVIVPAFAVLIGAATAAANALNSVFGTNLTSNQVLIAGFILDLIGGFKLLAIAMNPVVLGAFLVYEALSHLGASDTVAVLGTIGVALGVIAAQLAIAIAPLFAMTTVWALLVAGIAAAGVAIVVFWPTIKATIVAGIDELLDAAKDFGPKFARALFGDTIVDAIWRFSKDLSDDAAGWKKIFDELFGVKGAQAAESPLVGAPEKTQKDADALKVQSKSLRQSLSDDWENAKKKVFEFGGELGLVAPEAKKAADGTTAALETIPSTGNTITEWIKKQIAAVRDWLQAIEAGPEPGSVEEKIKGTGSATIEVISGTVSHMKHIFKEGVDGIGSDLKEIPKAAGEAGKATVEIIHGAISEIKKDVFKESGLAIADAIKPSAEKVSSPSPEKPISFTRAPIQEDEIFVQIGKKGAAALEQASPLIQSASEKLVASMHAALAKAPEETDKTLRTVKDAIVAQFKSTEPAARDAARGILLAFDTSIRSPTATLQSVLSDTTAQIAKGIESGKPGVAASAKHILQAIDDVFVSGPQLSDAERKAGEDMAQSLGDGIEHGESGLVTALNNAFDRAFATAPHAASAAASAFTKAFNDQIARDPPFSKESPGVTEHAHKMIEGAIKEFNKVGGEEPAATFRHLPTDSWAFEWWTPPGSNIERPGEQQFKQISVPKADSAKPPAETATPASAPAEAMVAAFANVKARIAAILAEIPGLVNAALGALSGSVAIVSGEIDATINAIISKLRAAIDEVRKLAGAASPSPGAAAGAGAAPPPQFGTGGAVTGAGTGTSDSILARLSNNEYVMRAAAVQHYGNPFMDAVNAMRFPIPSVLKKALKGDDKSSSDKVKVDTTGGGTFSDQSGFSDVSGGHSGFVDRSGFADLGFHLGGLVQRLSMPTIAPQMIAAPQFAGGGPVSSQRTFVLDLSKFGMDTYSGLSGPSHTISAMERHATLTQMSSTTKRTPSRVG